MGWEIKSTSVLICCGSNRPHSTRFKTTNLNNGFYFCAIQVSCFRKIDGTSAIDKNTSGGFGYPCLDQIGRGFDIDPFNFRSHTDQALLPAYAWNNTYNFKVNGTGVKSSRHIIENRYFYYENPAFDGTSGIGVGTSTDMDSIGTCKDHTAFWVTDEGSWNETGADGRLYNCKGNTWVLYYEPYTYLHPLRNSGGNTNTVQAPQNLIIVE